MANDMLKIVAILVVAWLVIGGGNLGTQSAAGGDTTGTIPGGCAYAPSLQVQEENKYNAGQYLAPAITYKVNGGSSITDADGTFEVSLGDTITVLQGEANKTQDAAGMYKSVATYTVDSCGLNVEKAQLLQNTSMTIQCFNQEGNLIGADTEANATRENETVAAGESVTLACQVLGVSKKGIPGGVLIVELSGTIYDEEDTEVTGGIITGKTSVPGAYTVSATANKAYAWNVAGIEGSGIRNFDLTFKSDDAQNPDYNGASWIRMELRSNNCYENSDTGAFECGVETEDNAWAGSKIGNEIIVTD